MRVIGMFWGALLALALSALSPPANAYPDKAIRIVVPFPPGGGTDQMARQLSERLAKRLNQPVIIENKPGAGGLIGGEHVAKAEPDGYSLLFSGIGPLAIAPHVSTTPKVDPKRDFDGVAGVASISNVLLVNPTLPVKTVAEWLSLANSRPSPLAYGSYGSASTSNLNMMLFSQLSGTPMTHQIPYKGASQARVDLIGGSIDTMFESLPPVLPTIREGKLRALAVTSGQRNPQLPDVPTMKESGFPSFVTTGWYGLVAPKGTPRSVVVLLNAEISSIVQTKEFQELLAAQGAQPFDTMSPEKFAEHLRLEYDKWGEVVRKAGIGPQ